MLYGRSLWFIYFTHIILCIWGFPRGSDGKESACNVGDQGLIPGWEDPIFTDSSVGKESTCNAGDLGLIPGLERSPGEEESHPLQYSGLENSMNCVYSMGSQRVDIIE